MHVVKNNLLTTSPEEDDAIAGPSGTTDTQQTGVATAAQPTMATEVVDLTQEDQEETGLGQQDVEVNDGNEEWDDGELGMTTTTWTRPNPWQSDIVFDI